MRIGSLLLRKLFIQFHTQNNTKTNYTIKHKIEMKPFEQPL